MSAWAREVMAVAHDTSGAGVLRSFAVSETPPPPPRPNLRRHARYELLASVEVHQGDETLILPARNLSLGGIYLGSDGNDLRRFKVGTSVEVLLFNAVDETHPPVRAGATIVRHDDD